MTAEETVAALAKYLLGDDWYSVYTNHEDIYDDIANTVRRRYRKVKESPVNAWRRRHKRCLFCAHAKYRENPTGTGSLICRAKNKIVSLDIPRPFCTVFELERDKE